MKLFRFLISGFCAVALMAFMSACSKEGDYTKALPAEASVLFKVNVSQLAEKSEIGGRSFMTEISNSVSAGMDEAASAAIREVVENPMKSGIDFRKPIYIAYKQGEYNSADVVAVIPVSDKAQLQSFIENVSSRSFEFKKDGDIVSLEMPMGAVSAAFDDCAFVISSDQNNDAKRLLKQSLSVSAVTTMPHFDALVSDAKDISVLMNYSSFIEDSKAYMSMDQSVIDLTKNLQILGSLNFEDGCIAMRSQSFCSDDYLEYVKGFRMDVDGRYMSCAPENSWGMFMLAVKNLESVFNLYSSELLGQMDQALAQVGLTHEDVSDIEGDIMAACLPLANCGGQQLPQGMLMVQTKSSKLWDAIAPQLPAENMVAPGVMSLGLNAKAKGSIDYYWGFVDNTFFIMPNTLYDLVAKDGKIKPLASNFTSARCAEMVRKGGFAIDVQAVVNALRMSEYAQDPSMATVLNYVARVDNLHTTYSEDMLSGEFCIELCDKSNALKQIFDIVEELK